MFLGIVRPMPEMLYFPPALVPGARAWGEFVGVASHIYGRDEIVKFGTFVIHMTIPIVMRIDVRASILGSTWTSCCPNEMHLCFYV